MVVVSLLSTLLDTYYDLGIVKVTRRHLLTYAIKGGALMPRGRLVVFGVVIALVSIALTTLAFLFVLPNVLPSGAARGGQPEEGGRTPGEAREAPFNPDERIQVVVALQRLPRGFTIPDDAYNNAVGVREWPAAAVPRDAIIVQAGQDPVEVIEQQVVGKITRTDIEREFPLQVSTLVDNLSDLSAVGSDIAAQLPAGARAISIPIDSLGSAGYGIQPGDRVDVILSFTVIDVDEDFQTAMPNWVYQVQMGSPDAEGGRTTASVTPQDGAVYGRIDTIPPGELANVVPSELQRPRLVTQRVIACAPVMYVGNAPLNGEILGREDETAAAQPAPDLVTVAVSPQEANVLRWAVTAQVDIGLSICSVQEGPETETSSVTLQYMFETYNVPNPPRLPYS